MKIYTRTGDSGETGLFGGPRVPKNDLRISAYGSIDELNAALGLAGLHSESSLLAPLIVQFQNELFAVGAELATSDPAAHGTNLIAASHVKFMEATIDSLESALSPLKQFILPGGTALSAALHLARTICRRSERDLVSLIRSGTSVRNELLHYLNRLGDLLFVMARYANHEAGKPDVPWNGCRPTT